MNQCDGCARKLPLHIGMHIGEQEIFMCTASRYALELEPVDKGAWIDEKARKKTEAPFKFGGGK